MKSDKWTAKWKSSKNPKKQKKYRTNAPLNVKRKLLSTNLSKTLREKYNTRNVPLRKGDKVKIMVGQWKGEEGKVETVSLKKSKIIVDAAFRLKKDGSKTFYPIDPSNLQIIELSLDDPMRKKFLDKFSKKKGEK